MPRAARGDVAVQRQMINRPASEIRGWREEEENERNGKGGKRTGRMGGKKNDGSGGREAGRGGGG